MASKPRRLMPMTLIVITALALSMLVGVSSAAAQSDYGADVGFTAACPDGWTELSASPFGPGNVVCRPNGFVVAGFDSNLCDVLTFDDLAPEVRDVLLGRGVVAGDIGQNTSDPSGGGITTTPFLCTFGGLPKQGQSCPNGSVEATVMFADPAQPQEQGCFYVLLVRGAGGGEVAQSICIEDTFDEPNAMPLSVGDQFRGENGVLYSISSCGTLNCVDGFDANCDGILGDFCPVEGRGTVLGAQACIEARNPDQASDSVVVPVSNAVAVPITAQPVNGLAHTGAETNLLAFLGTGLLGFGASAQLIRRRFF